MKKTIGQRAPLITEPLFLEGITRAGKFLLANVVNGFQDVEPVQYFSLLENIPYMAKFGLIEETTAQQIMQCEIDLHSYEMMIGRNLNHRVDDKSAVFNVAEHHQYLQRSETASVAELMSAFQNQQRLALYILHETMPEASFLFATFPKLKMISLRRHPVDLVYSWYKRGHGTRWGTDPTMFAYAYEVGGKQVPWFATGWADEYYQLSEIDRVIKSIDILVEQSRQGYQQLTASQRQQIMYVRFEDLLQQPASEIDRLKQFLGKKTSPDMATILEREHLPNVRKPQDTQIRLMEIKKLASPTAVRQLQKLVEMYHS